jgi:nucleoside-diphosphate-sugar epimerase
VPPEPICILGAGYTGRHISRLAQERGFRVLATSRNPDARLGFVPQSDRIEFDLQRPETWTNIPGGSAVIWCFPAAPPDRVAAFAGSALRQTARLVVLGSTSAYDLAGHAGDVEIDETAGIDLTRPRVQGEEYRRGHHGAVVLRIAGIYGPERNVLDWIRRGKVSRSPRSVNLIHVEDVAGICLAALQEGRSGEVYNVSDGRPRRWAEICEEAHRRWSVPLPPIRETVLPGKRLSIAKLERDVHYTLRFPDLYAALAAIEPVTSDPPPSTPPG